MKNNLFFIIFLISISSLYLQSNNSDTWNGNFQYCEDKNYHINLNTQLISSFDIINLMAQLDMNSLLVPKEYPIFLSGRPLIIINLELQNNENIQWEALKQRIELMMSSFKNKPGISIECSVFTY